MSFRSYKIRQKYLRHLKELKGNTECILCSKIKTETKKEFKYWVILPNDFPYDKIATSHDLLVLKRHAATEDMLTEAERKELLDIKVNYLPKTKYEVFYENMPKERSVKGHYHVQLIDLLPKYDSL